MNACRKLMWVALSTVLVAGCGLLPDRTLVYQKAEPAERMEIPEDMVFVGEEDLYPVPSEQDRVVYTGERFEPPEPPRLEIRQDDGLRSARIIRPEAGQARLTRDGNGYPIIMLPTEFALAWERVGGALEASELRVRDRNREAGIFYLRVSRDHGLPRNEVQLKLSNTVNGIQVAVLTRDGASLVDRQVSGKLLESLHERL